MARPAITVKGGRRASAGGFGYEARMLSRLDWNLVVTAHSGRRRDLVHALRPILHLRRAGFPEVTVGRTDDLAACLAALAETDVTVRREILARVIPIVRTFALDPAGLEAQLIAETGAVLDALVGRSFHVRVERRGLREVGAQSDVLERALGGALVRALTARGDVPRVTFADPDVVVAVELIGVVGGIGLIDRALRTQYPFVRA